MDKNLFIDHNPGTSILPYVCPHCKERALGIINDKYCLKCIDKIDKIIEEHMPDESISFVAYAKLDDGTELRSG